MWKKISRIKCLEESTIYKGVFLHIIAKLTFILCSYLMHFFLGRTLSPEMYGIVGFVITILNFDYLFLNNGVRQAVSHSLSTGKYNSTDVIKKGLIYQVAVVTVIFIANFFGADLISILLKDAELKRYIQLAAFIIPFTGLYFTLLGVFNGNKLFVIEASLATGYSILRLLVIPFVAFFFKNPIIGTEIGFFVDALLVCIFSVALIFKKHLFQNEKKPKIDHKTYIGSALGFFTLFSITTVIMNSGTVILKAVSGNNTLVGYYTGVFTFAQVPYFLLSAFFLVILPVVSNFIASGEKEKSVIVIRDFMTVIMTVILPIVVIIAATSNNLLGVFYKPEYTLGGMSLSFSIWGIFFLGMTLVFSMIISGANKRTFTVVLSASMLLTYMCFCIILTHMYSLTGTGIASFATCIITMFISAIYASKHIGIFWNKRHTSAVIINVVVFMLIKILSSLYYVNNMIILFTIYTILYVITLVVMRVLHIFSIRQVLSVLKKERAHE